MTQISTKAYDSKYQMFRNVIKNLSYQDTNSTLFHIQNLIKQKSSQFSVNSMSDQDSRAAAAAYQTVEEVQWKWFRKWLEIMMFLVLLDKLPRFRTCIKLQIFSVKWVIFNQSAA